MRRILIADDEYLIRKGLRAILERSGIGFEEICECENGLQALREMQDRNFDVAVVDIRMPEMDGLAAIREALELESPPFFLILSGYDDFNYARQAIRFGVLDYLMKPVDMEELLAAVRRAVQKAQGKRSRREDSAVRRGLADPVFENELNYILLNMNLQDGEVSEILDHIGAGFFRSGYRILSFELTPGGMASAGEYEALKDAVAEAAEDLNAYAAAFDYEKNALMAAPEALDTAECRAVFSARFGDGYALGVSAPGRGAADIRACYRQAVECRKRRILTAGERVIAFEDIRGREPVFSIPIEKIRRIQAVMGTPAISEAPGLLDEIFREDLAAQYGMAYLEGCAEAVDTYIVAYYGRLRPESLQAGESLRLRSIYGFGSIREYVAALRGHILGIHDYVGMLTEQYRDRNKMDEALRWLEGNCTNPNLSMSMAANHVSLNYTYFSLAFRERTGMSFVVYLKKLRVQRACALIDRGESRIGNVARMVGFQNPRLFSKSFREETGISPAQYALKTASLANRKD